jgi:uncharacterized UBP type Zn finger protein
VHIYQLQSLVLHDGLNMDSGHYIAITRDRRPKIDALNPRQKWWLFDDAKAIEVGSCC